MGYNLRMIISYEDDCLMSPVAVSSFIFFHHLFLFLSACCFCSYVPWNSLTFFKLSIKPKNRNCFFLLLTTQLIHSIFFSSFSHFQFSTNWLFDISRVLDIKRRRCLLSTFPKWFCNIFQHLAKITTCVMLFCIKKEEIIFCGFGNARISAVLIWFFLFSTGYLTDDVLSRNFYIRLQLQKLLNLYKKKILSGTFDPLLVHLWMEIIKKFINQNWSELSIISELCAEFYNMCHKTDVDSWG